MLSGEGGGVRSQKRGGQEGALAGGNEASPDGAGEMATGPIRNIEGCWPWVRVNAGARGANLEARTGNNSLNP